MYNIDEILKLDNIKLEPYQIKQLKHAKECLSFELLSELINVKLLSFNAISEMYKIDGKTVSRLAKKIYKIQVDSFKIKSKSLASVRNNLPTEEIIDLHLNQNKSCRQIGSIYNVSHGVIATLLKNNNVEIRSGYDSVYYDGDNKRQDDAEWRIGENGYVYRNSCGILIRQHVYNMEEFLGRKLNGKEVVHHIDLNKTNNSIDNLFLFPSQPPHVSYHAYLDKNIGKEVIPPQLFLDTIYAKYLSDLTYESLYHEYVVLNKTVSKIHTETNISRACIDKKLKEYNLK